MGVFEGLESSKKLEILSLPCVAFELRPYPTQAPPCLRRIECRARYGQDCRYWIFNERCAKRLKKFTKAIPGGSAIKEIHIVVKPSIDNGGGTRRLRGTLAGSIDTNLERTLTSKDQIEMLEQLRGSIQSLGITSSYYPPAA
jgi:hypothetical protein